MFMNVSYVPEGVQFRPLIFLRHFAHRVETPGDE